MSQDKATPHSRVLIVGAGVSGLYLAWRILAQAEGGRVDVFEQGPRVGGRLATATVEMGDRSFQVEEGGMRFLNQHLVLRWVLEKLGLTSDISPFGMGDSENFFYLRGEAFSREEAANGRPNHWGPDHAVWSTLYRLKRREQGKSPTELLDEVVTDLVRRSGGQRPNTPEQWLAFRKNVSVDKRTLHRWGFKPLLFRLGRSGEAIRMIQHALGFHCPFVMPINAGAALQLLANFSSTPQFKTLAGGYEQLTRRLRQDINRAGGYLHLSSCVTAIERASSPTGFKVHYRQGMAEEIHTAERVVLAIPTGDLQEMDLRMAVTARYSRFNDRIQGVVEMPLTKMNFFYEDPWWKKSKYQVSHGGCFTDLPLAQVYFFESPSLDKDVSHTPPVLTVYPDAQNAEFWRQLQESDSLPYSETVPATLTSCSTATVRETTRQLSEMFSVQVPDPLMATYRAWGTSGAGSGDHLWRIGAVGEADEEILFNPTPGLYICGESLSEEQAWVEGALRSAERIAQAGFGVPDLGDELKYLSTSAG